MAGGAADDRRVAEWIARVVAHDDHDSFAALVRLHQSPVRRFLRRLTGDQGQADDLAQETFWKAYRNIGSFEGRGRFLSWLFRIAYQLFATERRRRPALIQVPLSDELEAQGGEGRGDEGDPVASFVAGRTFDQLLERLRPEERAALVLHYRHELTHPEVAEILGLPLGTVKTLIRRSRLKLQRTQANEGEDEP